MAVWDSLSQPTGYCLKEMSVSFTFHVALLSGLVDLLQFPEKNSRVHIFINTLSSGMRFERVYSIIQYTKLPATFFAVKLSILGSVCKIWTSLWRTWKRPFMALSELYLTICWSGQIGRYFNETLPHQTWERRRAAKEIIQSLCADGYREREITFGRSMQGPRKYIYIYFFQNGSAHRNAYMSSYKVLVIFVQFLTKIGISWWP
jgi:hypothetical protein